MSNHRIAASLIKIAADLLRPNKKPLVLPPHLKGEEMYEYIFNNAGENNPAARLGAWKALKDKYPTSKIGKMSEDQVKKLILTDSEYETLQKFK